MKTPFFLLFILISIISFPFTSALNNLVGDSNFESASTQGLIISPPETNMILQGNSFNFTFYVYNLTSGLPVSSPATQCSYQLYNNLGEIVYAQNPVPYSGSYQWSAYVTADNFTNNGNMYYSMACNSTNIGGFISVPLDVKSQGNISIFLILAFAAILILGFAFISSNEYLGFVAGAVFIVTGVYAMIYGLGGFADDYTRSIGFVSIGLGLMFLIAVGYQLSTSSKEEE